MASGEAQFNTNCWIRGRMVAMTGTFSGTFSTEVADIVSGVNIRNGSVSSYLSYSFPAPGGNRRDTKDIEWVIPAQEYGFVTDMTIPAILSTAGHPPPLNVKLYRNGTLIHEENLTYSKPIGDSNTGEWKIFRNMISFRILDFDVPADQTVTYRFILGPGFEGTEGSLDGTQFYKALNLWFSGKVIAAIRKR